MGIHGAQIIAHELDAQASVAACPGLDQADATTEKIAQRSFFFGIDVGFGEFVQSQVLGSLEGITTIGFDFRTGNHI